MKIRLKIVLFFFFFGFILTSGQTKDQQLFLSGYIKNLNEFNFVNRLDQLQWSTLIHNRLNFKYMLTHTLKLRFEIRNRVFYGDRVQKFTSFSDAISNDNGIIDMSWNIIDSKDLIFNTTFDRVLLNFTNNKWDIALGRQRINWGVNLIWNPNDIFNTYNFLDFDYEERPGSDAIRVQYYFNDFQKVEVAAKKGYLKNDHIVAVMYKFNKWSYDMQLLTGIYQKDWMTGVGWAGNVKNAGFKGEISYFIPTDNEFSSKNVLSASLSLDYAFKKGVYVHGSFLYNNSIDELNDNFENLLYSPITPKKLMPFKYSWFWQLSKEFSPIFAGTLNTIYSGTNGSLILMPSFNYSLAENWEVNFTGQSFFELENNKAVGNSFYVRLRWSY